MSSPTVQQIFFCCRILGLHGRGKGAIMVRMRTLRVTLALAVALTPAAIMAQSGAISGKADKEAKTPYMDYSVQLRDAATGQVVKTMVLGNAGTFAFSGLDLNRRLVVELVNTKENKIVCTEGPYSLSTGTPSMTEVDVKCGKNPALWLLAAGAGTAALVAAAVQSGSQ
jgi:hypothetical protein